MKSINVMNLRLVVLVPVRRVLEMFDITQVLVVHTI